MSNVESDAVPANPMAFRHLLKTLDDGLGSEDCHKLCFLAADMGVPKTKLEHVRQATDIFDELEKQTLIVADNVGLLWELMGLIHRNDLLKIIEAYCNNHRVSHKNADNLFISKYRLLLLEIADNTSTSEMDSLKHGCKDLLGRQVVSKLKDVYQLFSVLEERQQLSPSNLSFLGDLLRLAGNMQMVEKINHFKNQSGPSDVELVNLSSKLGSEWRKLGTYLGLSSHTLQAIDEDNITTEDRIMQMLFTWRQSVSFKEDAYGLLYKALKLCNRMDLAEVVNASSQIMHYPSVPTSTQQFGVVSQPAQPFVQYVHPGVPQGFTLKKPSDFQSSALPASVSMHSNSGVQESGSLPRPFDNHGLPDQILRELSEHITVEWKKIGTFLNLDYAIIRRIDYDWRHSDDKAFNMLLAWRCRLSSGTDAITELASILKTVGRVDLSEQLKGIASPSAHMAKQLRHMGGQQPPPQPAPQPMIADPTAGPRAADPRQPHSLTDSIPENSSSEDLTAKMEGVQIGQSHGDHHHTSQAPLKQPGSENLTAKMEGVQIGQSHGDHHHTSQAPLKQPVKEQGKSINQQDQQESLPQYRMNRNPRGLCMIINNVKFQGKKFKNRPGSEVDAGKLDNLFNKLHFQVKVRDNLSSIEMHKWFKDVSLSDHSEFDCFACCILSHGALGSVYGSDCEEVEIQDILGLFKATSCASLKGKPKMFFIQACQGTVHQEGVHIETDDAQGVGSGMQRTLPKEADFLLSYATVPGYVSYRSTHDGTWFVNALVDVITKHHNQHDINTMLTVVNNRLSEGVARVKTGHMKQMSLPMFTLRKILYLRSLPD